MLIVPLDVCSQVTAWQNGAHMKAERPGPYSKNEHDKWQEFKAKLGKEVAEAPWSVAEWAVALRFDNPRATVPVLVLG